ncbi:hypothetical protein CYMTET_14654 [Cymbomonas tetramitiformis]|uniref:Vint domain-containing protein n=1 Tax=Cymbomonas tetramitiformis TaxID=36881 RepID=A0AAE0FIQ1_9CHLO|nr:hypothetical protein CYMTET_30603 [Cymbomonas tetramitiformis]KAK3277331.1 hypothetical protein CYMTET_14654 [Cymbomonas tetramitiformis]
MGLHADTLVHRVDADPIPARSLVRGMAVRTLSGAPANVVCVVRTDVSLVPNGCRLANCGDRRWISEYHPVCRISAQRATRWWHARDTGDVRSTPECAHVYDIVLDHEHTVCVGTDPLFGIATLGHRFEDNCVQHPYFGSDRIIQDLARFPSYKRNGLVDLRADMFVRDKSLNVIVRIQNNDASSGSCTLA